MPNQPIEFYENYNLASQFGYTPSIVNMLGGVSMMDSYTPLSAAEQTFSTYGDYLKRNVTAAPAQLVDYLYRVADSFGIDRNKAYKQIQKESNFNPNAIGRKTKYGTAKGIAQFIDSTAAQYGLKNPFDPYASFDAWGQYMADLLTQFNGDYAKALAAYNWGQGNVEKAVAAYGDEWLNEAPAETRQYVESISGTVAGRDDCGWLDVQCQVRKFFESDTGKDAGKRIALVAAAIIIIAAAIISLR